MASEQTCLNCGTSLNQDDKYCHQCGQGTNEHLLSFKELVSHFFNSFTNLDNSAFKTLKYINRPWKLTQFYVEGKKKSFLNPIRVFLILMLFHFGLLFSSINFGNFSLENEISEKYELNKMYLKYKEVKKNHQGQCDSLQMNIDTTLFANYDTLTKDTLLPISGPTRTYKISAKDIVELDQDSINKKYHFNTFFEKLFSKQLIRTIKYPSSSFQYILGNFIWVIILSTLLMAGFFKILYYKTKKPYVEHLVFLLNVHSFSFLTNTILFYLFQGFFNTEKYDYQYYIFFVLFPCIIFYVSMYHYYKQSHFKTLLKSSLCCGLYTFSNVVFLVFTILLSFFFF